MWIVLSGTRNEDPLLTRYALGGKRTDINIRRTVTKQNLDNAVKELAEQKGIKKAHLKFFSLKSFRSGYNVAMRHSNGFQVLTLEDMRANARTEGMKKQRSGRYEKEYARCILPRKHSRLD